MVEAWLMIGVREPAAKEITSQYFKEKAEFYHKFTPDELHSFHFRLIDFHEKLNKKKKAVAADSFNNYDFTKAFKEYKDKYAKFLGRQPQAEATRQAVLQDMAKSHETVSILKSLSYPLTLDTPTFDEPRVSKNSSQFSSKEIDDYIEERMKKFSNPYFIDESGQREANRIVKEIKDFVEERYERIIT